MTRIGVVLLALLVSLLIPQVLGAHGGGLDRNGCHTNRKTGDYHCHRAAPSTTPRPTPSPLSPAAPRSGPASGTSATIDLSSSRDETLSHAQLVLSIQLLLGSLGYDVGRPDGQAGAATREAIRRFQSDELLVVDGAVSGELLVRLAQAVHRRPR